MAKRRRSTLKSGKVTRGGGTVGTAGRAASTRKRPAGDPPVVTIRTRDNRHGESIPRSAPIERIAGEWTYILRSRSR
jgi:hypothetical protein